jgi:hypothetical protein
MCLSTAHCLSEIERAIIGLTSEAFEAPFDQTPQSVCEVVPAEELAAIDLAGCEILDLSDLLDQAIAGHEAAWRTELLYGRNRHICRY